MPKRRWRSTMAVLAALTIAPWPGYTIEAQEVAKPRVLTLTLAEGDDGPRDLLRGMAEEILQKQGLPLVDAAVLRARHGLDDFERFLLEDPAQAELAELKARFAIDALVLVRYSRSFRFEQEIAGTKQRFYRSSVRVKAVLSDSAEIVHTSGGETAVQARTTELEQLVTEHVKKAGEALLKRWSGDASASVRQIHIVASGFDHDGLVRLERALQTVPGILRLERHKPDGGVEGRVRIEVQSEVTAERLAGFLGELREPALEVQTTDSTVIEIAPAE
ncbi:hypothetical protein ACFL59_12260 [Planctomycetota bacterium]